LAGYSTTTGTGNVFLGHKAGYNETGSDKLYIDSSDTSSPLIYGDFSADTITINGSFTATSLSGDGSGLTNVTPASHSHAGTDITSGTVAEALIDAAIARDSEVSAHTSRTDNPHTVTAAQTGAASVVHSHAGSDITSGTVPDADLLDGQDSTAFMSATTDNWVDITGDTMTGSLSVGGDLSTDGWIGVGTQTPGYDVHIHNPTTTGEDTGTGPMDGFFWGLEEGNTAQFWSQTGMPIVMVPGAASTWADMTVFAPDGDVGIGIQNPTEKLYVVGNIYATGSITPGSSRELKENIRALPIDEAVKALNNLNPQKYYYKADREEEHVGFISEDVPELVATNDRKGVDPMDVVAVLTKVTQEQQKTINKMAREIKELKREMRLKDSHVSVMN
jgi:hypothetical protein